MPEDDERLGFPVDLDLAGVRRAMDGRREGGGRERGETVGLGLYQCRPPRRSSGAEGRRERRREAKATCGEGRLGVMGWADEKHFGPTEG